MQKKRSKFLTFVFSLLPGAGHMFMGFMKMGISLMSIFFVIIAFASWLGISALLFVLPVLWFYSFFDCINKRYSSDEEFEMLSDGFLFSLDKFFAGSEEILRKRRLFAGVLIFMLGLYLLWENIFKLIHRLIPSEVYDMIYNATRVLPQLILGIAIILIGIRLITGKLKEDEKNA